MYYLKTTQKVETFGAGTTQAGSPYEAVQTQTLISAGLQDAVNLAFSNGYGNKLQLPTTANVNVSAQLKMDGVIKHYNKIKPLVSEGFLAVDFEVDEGTPVDSGLLFSIDSGLLGSRAKNIFGDLNMISLDAFPEDVDIELEIDIRGKIDRMTWAVTLFNGNWYGTVAGSGSVVLTNTFRITQIA